MRQGIVGDESGLAFAIHVIVVKEKLAVGLNGKLAISACLSEVTLEYTDASQKLFLIYGRKRVLRKSY
jgi:hypothetical protein